MANIPMSIHVRDMAGRTYSIMIRPNDTIAALKAEIRKKSNLREDGQTLLFMGKTLEDEDRVYDHEIEEGCTVNLVMQSVGGKSYSSEVSKFKVPLFSF